MRYVAAAMLLASCAHSSAPIVTDADAARARTRWPTITRDDLNRGRAIYVGHCGNCHLVPKPTDHTAEDWPGHVSAMSERAGLTDDEEQLVVRYVVTMASSTASSP